MRNLRVFCASGLLSLTLTFLGSGCGVEPQTPTLSDMDLPGVAGTLSKADNPRGSSVGGPCQTSAGCSGDAVCYPEIYQGQGTGFLDGYCLVFGCDQDSCPYGSECINLSSGPVCLDRCTDSSDCRPGYGCLHAGGGIDVCFAYCSDDLPCPGGHACIENRCQAGCTPGSCPDGETCIDGQCVAEAGDGPGINISFPLDQLVTVCPDLPSYECNGGPAYCGELVPFDPDQGPGYVDYPENGETWENQYRSWIRRDTMMMIKYACAYVDCLTADWTEGNGEPLGLIDMSEQDGSIPGASVGQPGHPQGTHVNGRDIDVSYYQTGTPDNQARSICAHYQNGQEAYHCTAPPHLLDPWRTALFLGALFEHPNLRVVGAYGQAGPILHAALDGLCSSGWLSQDACSRTGKLTYETTNQGHGWYYFHHHHMHISFTPPDYDRPEQDLCLIPGCDKRSLEDFLIRMGL